MKIGLRKKNDNKCTCKPSDSVYHVIANLYPHKGNLIANEFREIVWGLVNIVALKGWGGCKQKGNDYTIFSLSNSSRNKWLLQMKNKYPNVQLHYLPDLPF